VAALLAEASHGRLHMMLCVLYAIQYNIRLFKNWQAAI